MDSCKRDGRFNFWHAKVYYMGEDVGVFGGAISKMYSLFKTFPERVMDMPLDEKGFTGVAVGMAWMGLRPIVEFMYPDFIVLAMNEIAHGACKQYWLSNQKCPVPMVIRSAQGIGSQCGAHHSECIEGWLMNYPGLKIAVPTFPDDAYGMMKYAIRDNDPVVWLDCRTTIYTTEADVSEEAEDALIPFGQARIRREGTDVTIVAWHKLLVDALAAAEELEKQGISCEVIDPRTLIPFDIETVLASVRKTGHLIIAHEANVRGGFGAEIAAQVLEREAGALKTPITRIGTPNTFIPVGTVEWQVTIIEMLPSILHGNDPDICRTMTELLTDRGVKIYAGAKLLSIQEGLVCTFEQNGETLTAEGAAVVMAAGRKPDSKTLGLEAAGVQTDRGFVQVDDELRTNIPHIYAIGDLTGKQQLAHVATAQGIVAAHNAAGEHRSMQYEAVPGCIYTTPEIACVGLTEEKAVAAGHKVKTGRFNVSGNGRSLAIACPDGFAKLVTDADTGKVLGCHILAAHATEMIGEVTLAIANDLSVENIANTTHAHPTVSEIIMEAAHDVEGLCCHKM